MHRYTRDSRHRLKPSSDRARVDTHHGDEFDPEFIPGTSLSVNVHREFTPKVPQTFDELNENVDRCGVARPNQMGPLIEGAEPVVTDNKSFGSYLAAFDKRSNSQPDVNQDCAEEFKTMANKLWNELEPIPEWDVDEIITERWLSKFSPEKRARMVKAQHELFDCEDDVDYLGEKTLSVKVEALLKRYDGKWAPRLIYAGNDHFNALTGPVAMVLCEELKKLTEKRHLGPIKFKFAYKEQGPALAAHLSQGPDLGYNHCAEGDFSANDLYQLSYVTKLCDTAFEQLGCPSWARKLFRDMRKFTAKNREFGHRAELENQLPTGTTLTTPRNTIWNMTIQACYAIATDNAGVADVLGDDFLAMLRKLIDPVHWSQWVDVMTGMKLKGHTPRLQGEATFLSRRLHVETEVPCMMPKLGKALARFNARSSANMAISDSQYMAGKALSYAYEFRHFPELRDLFLTRYRSEGEAKVELSEISYYTRLSGVDTAQQLEERIMAECVLISEDETREFLMDSYGDTFGLVDCRAIARRVILSTDMAVVPAPTELSIDF